MVNKVILIGNVGMDPEIRYTGEASNGTKVATLRLATSERYKDRNGNLQEHTEWHSVVLWRNLADVVEKYVKKGTQIYIEGRIRTRSWEDQTGAKKYTTEIMADNMQLLGRKSDNPGNNQGYGNSPAANFGYGQQQQAGYVQQQPGYPQTPAVNQAPVQAPPTMPATKPPVVKNIADDMPDDDLPF